MPKKPFILSDQSKNCYGFVVLTAGIDRTDFAQNPVMLYAHGTQSNPDNVIGTWSETYEDGQRLMGVPAIDEEDQFAANISRKVDKGILKGASIGIDFKTEDVSLNVPGYEGTPVITKCRLTEASICAIPANANALRLFADGKQLTDNTLSLSLSKQTDNPKPEIDNMKQIQLFAAALGLALSASTTEEHVLAAVQSAVAEREAFKLKLTEAENKLAGIQDAAAVKLVNDAVESKKINATQKDHFLKLAKSDFESTESILNNMVPHLTLTDAIRNEGAGKQATDPYAGWDIVKLSREASGELERIRAKEPERYKQLFKNRYGYEPNA